METEELVHVDVEAGCKLNISDWTTWRWKLLGPKLYLVVGKLNINIGYWTFDGFISASSLSL